MDQKAFDLIISKLDNTLKPHGFERQKGYVDEKEGKAVLFVGENLVYSVIYNEEEKRFELRSTDMTDDGPDTDSWKSISNWLYDPEHDTMKDVESIAADFVETLKGSDRQEALRKAKRKAHKDKDNNPDPVFFYKRLVTVLPALKDEIAEEMAAYEEFRSVTFGKACVLPKVEELAKAKGSGNLKKLCAILDDLYKNGDLDVRSIITMVLLNGLSSDELRGNVLENMSPSFKKYYKRAIKYKDKKVKPEREKRKSSAGTSTTMPERLSGKIPKR